MESWRERESHLVGSGRGGTAGIAALTFQLMPFERHMLAGAGDPYPLEQKISPAPVPEPPVDDFIVEQVHHMTHFPYAWTIAGSAAGLLLIFIVILVCISFKSSSCCRQSPIKHEKDTEGKNPHKFHILGRTSFCCASGRSVSVKSGDWKSNNGGPMVRQMTIPRGI